MEAVFPKGREDLMLAGLMAGLIFPTLGIRLCSRRRRVSRPWGWSRAAEEAPGSPQQLKVLREALAERPHITESLAELFKRKPRKSVEDGLLSLVAVGRAEYEQETGTWYAVG